GQGFVKKMVPIDAPGPVWIDGLMTLKDERGAERLLAHFTRVKGLEARLQRGIIAFNDEEQQFEQVKPVDLDALLSPGGHPFRVKVDGQEYFYFPTPYPVVRVRADWKSVLDLATYEAYTPLVSGARYEKANSRLDRNENGELNW